MKSKILRILLFIVFSINCVKAQSLIVNADLLSFNELAIITVIDKKENKQPIEFPRDTLMAMVDVVESDLCTTLPAVLACSITGTTTICRGQSTTLTASGGGTYLWSTGATSAAITISPTTNTTYTVTVTNGQKQSICSQTVTVNPVTVGGTVTGGTTICSGSSANTLTLINYTGSIQTWQIGTFNCDDPQHCTITWSNISGTSNNANYSPGVLNERKAYRVIVQSGVCSTAYSVSDTVIVNPTSVGGSVSGGTTICYGSTSGLLTLTDNVGTVTKWQSSVYPNTTWTDISNTSTTYTSGVLTATTQFRAVVQSGVCATANSSTTTVTVSPTSIGGSVSGSTTICTGSTSGVLTLSGHTGAILKWQSSVYPYTTWTDISNTSTTYTSGVLTATTQFRAVVQSGVCANANSLTTIVTVSPTTVGGSVSGGTTICTGSTSGVLTLSGHTGAIVKWQSSVYPYTTWTDISNTSTTCTSGVLTATTQFRAVVQSNPCATATSAATTVTVSPTTVGGAVTGGTTICSGNISALLTLAGHTGTVVRWESSVSPFSTWTPITNTNTTYTSGALTATTHFRAVVQSSPCATATSATTIVIVSPATVGGAVTGGTTICSGSNSALLTLAGHTGTVVRWESSVSPFSTWTPITNTNTTYTSGALTATTQFRVVVQSGSCATANSDFTTVVISPASVGDTVTGGTTICSGSTSGILTLAGYTGNIVRWESSISPYTTWAPITNTSATYTSGVLTATTQFRAVVKSGVCSEVNSVSSFVTVNPLPTASAGSNSPICSGTTLNLTSSGGTTYSWLSTNGFYSTAQNPSIQNISMENAGTYTVTVTDNNACTSTALVLVEIKAQPIITNIINNLICVGETIELKSNGGTTYQWSGPNGYSSSNSENSILNATANRSGLYTVTVSGSNNCTTTASSVVQVSDKPVASAGNDVIACHGTLVTLTASGGNSYTWSTEEHAASISVNPRSTTIYTVEATNLSGCKAVDQVKVTVKPAISLFSVTTKPSNCTKGGNINLSGSEIGISYQLLKDGIALGDPIAGTGDALFFQSVTSDGTYTIKATRVNDNCERIMNGSFIIN